MRLVINQLQTSCISPRFSENSTRLMIYPIFILIPKLIIISQRFRNGLEASGVVETSC